MLELDYITIEGFRSIASIEKLEIHPINVLIGPNGSGKSNFVGVFSFLQAIRQGGLRDYVAKAGGAGRLLHFGPAVTDRIAIKVSFQNESNAYEIRLEPTETDDLLPSDTAYFWDKSLYNRPFERPLLRQGMEAGISREAQQGVPYYVHQHLDRWRLYHFQDTSATSAMKRAADVGDNRFLRPDGSNLSAFIHYLREEHPNTYSLIRGAVKQVAPFFRDFQVEPRQLDPSTVQLDWLHEHSDAYFGPAALSDGTLRFMALVTLFLQPPDHRPSVILVDEPELGLHPYAITVLASLMKQASTTSQVIISTQSSLLLDHFEPEDVLVAELKDGATQISRLDAQRLEAWLEDYSLGQLWEKNEIGGRP